MNALQRLGLTPPKAALIGTLAIAMGWVWSPLLLGGSSSPRSQAAKVRRETRADPKPSADPAQPTKAQAVAPVGLPVQITLSQAIQHDPFAAPAWAPQTQTSGASGFADSSSSLQQRFESLASPGVAMLLLSERGKAAQIGTRTVHVGDVIDGFRVVEISKDGVRFVPDPTGDGHGA